MPRINGKLHPALTNVNLFFARLVFRRPYVTTLGVSFLFGIGLVFVGLRGTETGKTLSTLFFGLGTALLGIFIAELAKFLGEMHGRLYLLGQFEGFFGEGAASRKERGRIILQADTVDTLLKNLPKIDKFALKSVLDALGQNENNRLHKARTWVNSRDAKSAGIVRDELRRGGFPTPDLKIIEHSIQLNENNLPIEDGDPFKGHEAAPYIISMGLAFTETTTYLQKQLGGIGKSFFIDKSSKFGDALVLRDDCIHKGYDNLNVKEQYEPSEKEKAEHPDLKGYSYVFPMGWSLPAWRGEIPCHDLKDYALILRHTAAVGNCTQTRFILAGFTEDSTVQAGHYFVTKWQTLYQDLVKGKRGSEGDFLIVISGDARAQRAWPDKPNIVLRGPRLEIADVRVEGN